MRGRGFSWKISQPATVRVCVGESSVFCSRVDILREEHDMSRAVEYLIVHVLLVAGTLALCWAPVVVLVRMAGQGVL